MSPDLSVGYIVASQMSFGRTLVVIESLMRSKCSEPTLIEECCAHLKTMGTLEQERNKITHSIWLARDDLANTVITRLKVTARKKKGLAYQTTDMTSDDLHSLADRIQKKSEEFTGFFGKCVQLGLIITKT